MRFATKFDRWLVILLILIAIVTCVVEPAIAFLTPGSRPGSAWVLLTPVIWLAVLAAMLPQYYEVRKNGLFLRQGWKKTLIPYASLVGIQARSDSMSAGVFSTDRLLIVTENGKRFLIAVAEQERFLAEVSKRCPQLEPRNLGLGMPFSPALN